MMTNKNYFNFLNKDNSPSSIKTVVNVSDTFEGVRHVSEPTNSILTADLKEIEKNLVKDIAVAVSIIDKIISTKAYANNPILKQVSESNENVIAKRVSKIISEAIVNPNLIALEKSIKELLLRKSIFTNFKA